MNRLVEKAKNYILDSLPKLVKAKKLGMKLLIGYVWLAAVVLGIYLFAFFYQWIVLKQLVMKDLKDLLTILFDPRTIAAFGFVLLMLVDKNHNGIPDDIEKKLSQDLPFEDKK